jgi:hypothetical protein
VELIMLTLKTMSSLALVAAVTALSGCAAYKVEPPAGFVVVSEHGWETRMKAQDNVGLSVRRFDNVKGGSLSYWAADLVKKLGNRGYTLKNQSAVKTRNGKTGTRFDFDYETYDTNLPKFYTAVLFVTDKHKVVLQVAGGKEFGATYSARVPEMLLGSKICRGPQPPQLSTPAPIKVAEPETTPVATPAASPTTPAATPVATPTTPAPTAAVKPRP